MKLVINTMRLGPVLEGYGKDMIETMTRPEMRGIIEAMREVADNSIQNASTSVLEHLLDHDTCDVDPKNRLNGDTPLHLAIRGKWEDHVGLRVYLGKS
jgi:hypothetical protein